MNFHKMQPRESLNKAFLKVKPNRNDIENFKKNLHSLIEKINESESEEFHKNLIGDFLKNTYYGANHFINTKGRNDFVIHNGKDAKSKVGVILEAKKPTNKSEMLKADNLNTKALQELVLYFLRERLTEKNLEIKYLIATNIYEWFIFDANIFEKAFIENKTLVQQFTDFEEGRLSSKKTDFFYKEIAKPAIDEIADKITFTHFDIRECQQYLEPGENLHDHQLIPLFKLFSPEHLLKLPFANDSNTLDKGFYSELLHIIGLTETKEGGKKLIQRKQENERNTGSLIENAINQLDSLDKVSRLQKPEQFGETYQEQLFNLGLELAITWVNRILFLKLLEAQLIKYHRNDLSQGFLNLQKVPNYDDLNSLFFSVLARKQNERNQTVQKIFAHVPYLNSSLFEQTDIEHQTVVINQLRNENLQIFSSTILKDSNGKKRIGEINALEYLFEFLNAYDFSSETGEEIQEENKRLINAAVLGLIFEKINGYKDGSFFTPGFITMYMCRETIIRAVVQKFNEVKGWSCENINDLQEDINNYIKQHSKGRVEARKKANAIINTLKICDPAVGSGHFLVSALNEIIAIKQKLGILQDKEGSSLSGYTIEVANDELVVTDNDGLLFEYNPKNPESQRIQETLFHEKQTIIESCLFGVDINPNSVKICQLRLWIELLKNAYYKTESNYTELETLPNIDINIKEGNSLISRFGVDVDLKTILIAKKSQSDIEKYKAAVRDYFNAKSKDAKKKAKEEIIKIQQTFKDSLKEISSKIKLYNKLRAELHSLENQQELFEKTKKEQTEKEKKIIKLKNEIGNLDVEIKEIESGKIYDNAFEWRFEFPEVLNHDGVFVGFDVVIGNPPYGTISNIFQKNYITNNYLYGDYQLDIYVTFFELTEKILKKSAILSFIVPNTWLLNLKTPNIRKLLFSKFIIHQIRLYEEKIFEEAVVDIVIFIGSKNNTIDHIFNIEIINMEREILINQFNQTLLLNDYKQPFNIYESKSAKIIKEKLSLLDKLDDIAKITQGTKPFQKGKGKPPQTQYILDNKPFVQESKKDNSFRPLLRGSLINKYAIIWNDNYYISFGDWLAEPRYSANYDAKKKIIIRQTGSKLICTLDYNQFVVRDNLYTIISTKSGYTEEIILGLLNSFLLNWYYQNIINNEVGEALAQVKRGHLAILPIPKINLDLFDKVINRVDKILTAKKSDPNADTTALETEIDQLVYQLYELTAEEIKIIEG